MIFLFSAGRNYTGVLFDGVVKYLEINVAIYSKLSNILFVCLFVCLFDGV
jgi:hypothetical protein